jgi:RND family efflux transporter MFP subunit
MTPTHFTAVNPRETRNRTTPGSSLRFRTLALRFTCALPLAIVLFQSSCKQAQPASGNAGPPPPTVTISAGEQRKIVDSEIATARLDAIESVEVRPRVSGHITEIHFSAGQLVKQGDLLFVIDRRWYKADLDRTTADVAKAAASLENAERISRRADSLLKTRAVAQEEADARKSEADEAAAALKSAEAARDTAQLDYEQSEVRAPISGRIGRALLTEGNYVSGVSGYNTLLTTVVSVDPVYAYATLDESAYLRVMQVKAEQKLPLDAKGNLPIQMELTDEEGFPRTGYIESFDNRLNAETASITVRAIVPNSDGKLTPGLFARVRIPVSAQHQALVVSEKAIGTDQGQKFVYVVDESDVAQYRKVTLGTAVDGKRIIQDGVSSTDQVIVDGQARVRPGMKVTPQKESRSAAIVPAQKKS